MAKFSKNSKLARLAKLTSDNTEILSRINKIIGAQREPDEDGKPQ